MPKEKKTEFIDPEQERWYKTYPKFLGVGVCVEQLRRNNVTGGWLEQIFYELKVHAAENAEELVAAFHAEQNTSVRTTLLTAIAYAASPAFEPLLIESLHCDDDSLRYWARAGLEKLNTKTARTALWEAKQSTKQTEASDSIPPAS